MPDAGSLPGRARHACVVATQVPGRTQLQPRTRGVLVKWFSVPKHMSLCCRPQVFPGAAGSEPQLQPQHRPPTGRSRLGLGCGRCARKQRPQAPPFLAATACNITHTSFPRHSPASRPHRPGPAPHPGGTAHCTLHSDDLKALSQPPSRRAGQWLCARESGPGDGVKGLES